MPALSRLPPLNGRPVRCPRCSSGESKVIDSRVTSGGAERQRRRECGVCGERFTTWERMADALPQVVKRSGDRTAFDPGRLRRSILKAIEKRPVTAADVDTAVGRIRERLPLAGEGEILSARIGEWVMNELRALDPVAYVRFAAGRRRFVDMSELPDLRAPPREGEDDGKDGGEAGRSASRPDRAQTPGPQLPLVPRE